MQYRKTNVPLIAVILYVKVRSVLLQLLLLFPSDTLRYQCNCTLLGPSTVLVTTAVTMVTSCDGMLGVASDVGGVGVGLEGPGLGPGNGRAVRGGSAK